MAMAIAHLIPEFIAGLPEQVAVLDQKLEEANLESIRYRAAPA